MSVDTLNSLSNASSSYLRSAMHQPIRWHEWREEAFEEAKRENKPILLDIGAVWCHWCHVMDRESYDDPEIAQIVNERFVAIKVDRDERPDIDSRYQVAVQAISGQGGWPLTAFLTPDGKPFYGGTYFPPGDSYGRPSFRRALISISAAYREKNADVVEQAGMVEGAIAHSESFSGKAGDFSPSLIQEIVDSALKMFDETHGGFGSAPKFPHPSMIDLLIDQYARSISETALRRTGEGTRPHVDIAEHLKHVFAPTLEKMARGGVYDQLAGGFHRYSVDERWIVPHFEKMSYDNSYLLKRYAARLQRPTPYIDKTVYVSWNALCISAYLKAATVLRLDDTKRFALKSLDRILAEAWRPDFGLKHVVAYSDAIAAKRDNHGFLDDYAFTAIACLDAYESTADLSYFRIARQITDQMIERFYDSVSGGFFDAQRTSQSLGVLGAPRKPFQDSPTPAGNPMAVIAL